MSPESSRPSQTNTSTPAAACRPGELANGLARGVHDLGVDRPVDEIQGEPGTAVGRLQTGEKSA
jgi:hypothetical protein